MSSFFAAIRKSFGGATASRSVAKDRLSIMLVHQRNLELLSNVDMEALQKEVAVVVQKYIKLARNRPVNLSGKRNLW